MGDLTDTVVPAVTILMMLTVGHGLTAADFRRSATDPRALISGTVGQLILLPAIATVIILVAKPSPIVVAGLVVIAACPGGALSNFYSCLANANTALSVTLTAISCLLSAVTVPALVAAGFFFWLGDHPEISTPLAPLTVKLLLLVAAPVSLGMLLRRWRPEHTERRDSLLRKVSLAVLVAVIAWVVWMQWPAIGQSTPELVGVAFVFTVLATAAGYAVAWITGRPAADRLTFVIEFPCRNLALALLIAVSGLGTTDILGFAAVLLLVQAVVMLGIIALKGGQP